jgi:hypothetical protein
MKSTIVLIILAMFGFSGCNKQNNSSKKNKKYKQLNEIICDALIKKGTECKMPLFLIGMKHTCNINMGKQITDYDIMEKWSKMPCEKLKTAWNKLMEAAKKKKLKRKK